MKSKSLSFKLFTSIFILIFLILSAAIYSILMINKTQTFAEDTGKNWLPSVLSGMHMAEDMGDIARRELICIGDKFNRTTESKKSNLELFENSIKKFEDNLKKHNSLISGPEEKAILDEIKKYWAEYSSLIDAEIILLETNKWEEATTHFDKKSRLINAKIREIINKLSDFNYKGGIASTEKGADLTSITSITMISIIILSCIISFAVIQIIRKSTKSLEIAIKNLKTQSISTNQMASSLKKSSHTLSDSVAEQAAAIHQTSAAINQITSMVNRTAENAKESTNVAKSASDKSDGGQRTMERLVAAMDTIQESSNQLQNIAGIIKEINSKTKVINDIVTKTELLSLNASIESARAGAIGKGFAVVAEEVGNLAKVSGKAAQEIQELINKSQDQVNQILEITKTRVIDGKQVTSEAQESLHNISEDISTMSSVIGQISDATREQEIGVRQISTAMSQIDRATQNSQIEVNTTADLAKGLLEQSENLDSTSKNIEILIMGSRI